MLLVRAAFLSWFAAAVLLLSGARGLGWLFVLCVATGFVLLLVVLLKAVFGRQP